MSSDFFRCSVKATKGLCIVIVVDSFMSNKLEASVVFSFLLQLFSFSVVMNFLN